MSTTTDELGSLDELLGSDPDLDTEFDPTAPEPIIDERINRLLAAKAHADHTVRRLEAQRDQQRAEFEARAAEVLRPAIERAGRIDRQLELAHRAIWLNDQRRTRLGFMNGTLTSKAGQVEWEYDDEAAALAWAEVNAPELVDHPDPPPAPPARLSKVALKALVKPATLRKGPDGSQEPVTEDGTVLTPSGEVVPGVRVVKRERTFTPTVNALTDDPFAWPGDGAA